MFAKLTTRDCPVCDTGTALCHTKIMFGEGRCCETCRHDRRQEVTADWPDADPPDQPPNRPPRVGASDDEDLVRSLLDRAEIDEDPTETYNNPSLSAYRSLAASRGVTIEAVIRHAVRDELRRIVALPTVRNQPPKENQ